MGPWETLEPSGAPDMAGCDCGAHGGIYGPMVARLDALRAATVVALEFAPGSRERYVAINAILRLVLEPVQTDRGSV